MHEADPASKKLWVVKSAKCESACEFICEQCSLSRKNGYQGGGGYYLYVISLSEWYRGVSSDFLVVGSGRAFFVVKNFGVGTRLF